MDDEARGVLSEAALAAAFGAFASRGGNGGPIRSLVAAMELVAILADDEPEPPAEILGVAAEDRRVEVEIDRVGEAVDWEFGRPNAFRPCSGSAPPAPRACSSSWAWSCWNGAAPLHTLDSREVKLHDTDRGRGKTPRRQRPPRPDGVLPRREDVGLVLADRLAGVVRGDLEHPAGGDP